MKNRSIAAVIAALAISSTAAFAVADNTKNADSKWLLDASKLEGTDVWDFHGNKLGGLQQVLLDPQTGRIRYGVIEVDKSWNWSDPQVAVPWDSFAVKRGDDKKTVLSIDATKEKLQNAPKFKAGDAERLFSKEASQPIYSYWSVYWFEEPAATTTSNADSADTTSNTSSSGTTSSADSPASTQSDANAPASTTNNANEPGGTTPLNKDANNPGDASGTTGASSNANPPAQTDPATSPKE